MAKKIEEDATQADNNLKYLHFLQAPCQELTTATPKTIPDIIPRKPTSFLLFQLLTCLELLIRVRMIFEKCEYYKSQDRICGLLKKISNEIIQRCIASIDVNDMFEGDVELCME